MHTGPIGGMQWQEHVAYHQEVTDAVQHFAEARSLNFSPYYHDLALWIVGQPEVTEGVTATIQVIGYLKAGAPWIAFVSSVRVFAPGSIKIPRQADSLSYPMTRYISAEKFGFDVEQFNTELVRAWGFAETLQNVVDTLDLVTVPTTSAT